MTLSVYEAGCLTWLHKQNLYHLATEWRETLDRWAKDNNHKTINPAKVFATKENHLYSPKLIVQQNDFFLKESNAMVVQLDYLDKSSGTIYELVTYKQLYPWKPVIAFSLMEGTNQFKDSLHINQCISEKCNTIEEVIILLSSMFS